MFTVADAGMNTYCRLTIEFDALFPGTPANIRIYLIFLETRIIGLHFATDSMDLSGLPDLSRSQ